MPFAMQPDHGGQVELGHDVAIEHDDRFSQLVACVLDRTGRAQRYRLDHVANLDSEVSAIAKHLFDAARLVVEAENDFVDFGHLLQQINLVMEKRPVEDRNDGLRSMHRQRTQAGALAPCKENSLHDNPRSYTMGFTAARSCRVAPGPASR